MCILNYYQSIDVASVEMNGWKITAEVAELNGKQVVELKTIDSSTHGEQISYAQQKTPLEWLKFWAADMGKEITFI